MKSPFDPIYKLTSFLAVLALLSIAGIILADVTLRQFGGQIRSSDDFAGFALAADEVIITAATALVMPATQIDGHMIGGGQPGPVARRLRNIYFDLAEQGGALG